MGRRAKRILPALYLVLLFCVATGALLLSPLETQKLSSYATATVLSACNILAFLSAGYFEQKSATIPLLMTWSLGVEEQFYILFPLCMLLMRKLSRRVMMWGIALPCLLSMAACIMVTRENASAAFYLIPLRAWELGSGVLLAMFEANRATRGGRTGGLLSQASGLAGLLLILYSATQYSIETPFPGYAAMVPVLGTVMALASRSGPSSRVLAVRPLRFIGLISYSWYLWHWPLLAFARIATIDDLPAASAALIAVVSFALAVASYKLVEQPFRESRLPAGQLLFRYGIASVGMLAVCGALSFAPYVFPGNEHIRRLDAEVAAQQNEPCFAHIRLARPRLTPPCVPSVAGPTVALLGDSRANSLAGTLRQVAIGGGYQYLELTKAACPPLIGVSHRLHGKPDLFAACAQYNRERFDYVLHNAQIKIAILDGAWSTGLGGEGTFPDDRYAPDAVSFGQITDAESREYLREGLERSVEQLESKGVQVYVLQDNPTFSFDPELGMQTRLNPSRAFLSRLLGGQDPTSAGDYAKREELPSQCVARTVIATVAARHAGTRVYDLQRDLCKGSLCMVYRGEASLYINESHLSPAGSSIALQHLRF